MEALSLGFARHVPSFFSRTLIAEQCVVRYNFSSGSSLVLHILKPYDFGFEPPKKN
jgi:hypothetical protein